jgi:hypothetical protein
MPMHALSGHVSFSAWHQQDTGKKTNFAVNNKQQFTH